jgi:hypothetical protein
MVCTRERPCIELHSIGLTCIDVAGYQLVGEVAIKRDNGIVKGLIFIITIIIITYFESLDSYKIDVNL